LVIKILPAGLRAGIFGRIFVIENNPPILDINSNLPSMNEQISAITAVNPPDDFSKKLWSGYLPQKIIALFLCFAVLFIAGIVRNYQTIQIRIQSRELNRSSTAEDYSRISEMTKRSKSLNIAMTLAGLFIILIGLNLFANLDPKELAVIFRDFREKRGPG
jgi:hypothetical protein